MAGWLTDLLACLLLSIDRSNDQSLTYMLLVWYAMLSHTTTTTRAYMHGMQVCTMDDG